MTDYTWSTLALTGFNFHSIKFHGGFYILFRSTLVHQYYHLYLSVNFSRLAVRLLPNLSRPKPSFCLRDIFDFQVSSKAQISCTVRRRDLTVNVGAKKSTNMTVTFRVARAETLDRWHLDTGSSTISIKQQGTFHKIFVYDSKGLHKVFHSWNGGEFSKFGLKGNQPSSILLVRREGVEFWNLVASGNLFSESLRRVVEFELLIHNIWIPPFPSYNFDEGFYIRMEFILITIFCIVESNIDIRGAGRKDALGQARLWHLGTAGIKHNVREVQIATRRIVGIVTANKGREGARVGIRYDEDISVDQQKKHKRSTIASVAGSLYCEGVILIVGVDPIPQSCHPPCCTTEFSH
ncbi:hypothetical protein EV368DRAFT_67334 [Lentinula lateritia]|nr:hypothetical protein EV368DRAFT_67334 [Lentinula lateritia]